MVWVSHSDASAYCHFYGQRLPHSWEWQWFAQGTDERPWPWGYEDPDESRMPVFSNAPGVMPAPDDVDVHPMGASWAGKAGGTLYCKVAKRSTFHSVVPQAFTGWLLR